MGDFNASIDQTLPILTQDVWGEVYNPNDRSGPIVQTLPSIVSVLTGSFFPGTSTATITQTLPILQQAVRGSGNTQNVDTLTVTDTAGGFATVDEVAQSDSVEASDSAIDGLTEQVSDSVNASDSASDINTAITAVSDSVLVEDDGFPPLWSNSISDSAEASDSVHQGTTEFISDSVEVTDSAPSYTYLEVISDSATAIDSSPVLWLDSITDVVLASDTPGELRVVLEIISDAVEVVDAVISYAGTLDQAVDIVLASDTATSAPSTINSAVTDTVIALDYSYAADFDSLAWVMNTETGAPWLFTNFNFNSVIEHAGMLFGGAQDGLYYLSGDDDAGRDIDAEILTGMLDFGFSNKKRISSIYFGYTGGELECDVESYDQPNDIYTYGMEERLAEAPRNNRIKLGKGLKSRYWRFTIRNVAGAAFQVYDKFADVVASKRRL
jgi:hypothetical protein